MPRHLEIAEIFFLSANILLKPHATWAPPLTIIEIEGRNFGGKMAKEVDAGLEKIANTKFYSLIPDEAPDADEPTERIDLTFFNNERRPDESLKKLMGKS